MSRSVARYRVYCQTEQAYVYTWGETAPAGCPTNGAHTIDAGSVSVVDRVETLSTAVTNLRKTPFGELSVAAKTPVIELKSMFGKSALRDIYTTSAGGSVTNAVGDGEYRVRVQGASGSAVMQSTERGRYIAGHGAEVGIGLRMPVVPAGGQAVKWGLFDESNGFYYIHDAAGLGVCVLRDGVETRIVPSASLDVTTGHIYQVMFSWYGYGEVRFVVSTRDAQGLEQEQVVMHTYFADGQTSVKNPNLPIRVEVTSGAGDGAGDVSAYVSGRQYSVLGAYLPIRRINAAYRAGVAVTTTGSFQHVLTVRRKAGFASNAVKLDSLDYVASAYMVLQLRVNTAVSGGSYGNIPEQDAGETVMEVNETATGASGGLVVWTAIAPTDRVGAQQVSALSYNLPEYQTLALFARALDNGNGSLTAVLRWSEEW